MVQRTKSSIFLDHDLGRFHHDADGIALFQSQFVGARSGNHAFNHVLSHADHHVSHHVPQSNLFDKTRQLIASGKWHINVVSKPRESWVLLAVPSEEGLTLVKATFLFSERKTVSFVEHQPFRRDSGRVAKRPVLPDVIRQGMLLLSLSLGVAAQSNAPSRGTALQVGGQVSSPFTVTLEEFQKLPHQEVTVQEHEGTKAVYRGVPVLTLLQRAGAPTGKQLKGKALASYVLASARDGYQVTFSLAELDPEIRDSTVIVADQREGKALPEQVGPFRLIAATDKKPARSVRMLTTLQVILLRSEKSQEP